MSNHSDQLAGAGYGPLASGASALAKALVAAVATAVIFAITMGSVASGLVWSVAIFSGLSESTSLVAGAVTAALALVPALWMGLNAYWADLELSDMEQRGLLTYPAAEIEGARR